jgi:hypothetical protein
MTADTDFGAEVLPEWEYVPLGIPADVSRLNAAVQLSLHAEYGGWELARVLRYTDGRRQVWLRRKRRPVQPGTESLPLPGLSR